MRYFIFTSSMVLTVLFYLSSTQLKAQESYTELNHSNAFSSTRTSNENDEEIIQLAETIQLNDLTIFSDEVSFSNNCNSTQLENFASTNVPPDTIEPCPGPFNSFTNNNCFTPGALIDGFSLIGIPFSVNGDLLVVITPPFEGITDVLVGPDDFNDDTEITFQNGGTQAVGLHIYTLAADNTITDVDIFGPGDTLLGSTTLTVTPNGQFFGVVSAANSPITHISFTNGYGELFTDLSFGNCKSVNIPTMSEWGLIALAAAMGIIGYAAFSRRKQTA